MPGARDTEQKYGPKTETVEAFLRHLEGMTLKQLATARSAARIVARIAAWVKAKMKSRLKVTIIVLSLVIALGAVVVVNGFIYG